MRGVVVGLSALIAVGCYGCYCFSPMIEPSGHCGLSNATSHNNALILVTTSTHHCCCCCAAAAAV